MTLEEAIKHCEQKAGDNSECALEHRQLAKWLKQLQTLLRSNKAIEERAKEAGIICQYKSDYRYDKRSVESGYMQGATEQKAIDDAELSKLKSAWGNETQVNRRYYIKGYRDAVEKSCELLREMVECGVHPSNAYGFADRFRKTLEDGYGNENTKEI